ncbi:MAG TPA: LysR family transcriptional regulator [Stellaceae bacterium]|jgi:DNA-binding transcriptional LysR family regulator|nr:LysR family transcriptional regulator [Stellaceae bacterium]
MNWDDIRIFLAVARHGSLRAAGRALGLSQPTVGRRLAAFEQTFGGPTLFDRLPDGLRLNAAGEALVAAAERLESAALALERRRIAGSPSLSGTVRVSVGEWAEGLLARHSGRTHAGGLPQGITLELVESPQTANLARRDADLALRHGVPEAGNLFVSKVGAIAGALYRRHDGGRADLGRGAAWVTYTEEQAHYVSARWLDQQIRNSGGRVVLRGSNLTMRAEAIRAGVGVGLLPCYAGDSDPLLERVTDPVPELTADYWVIVHRDLRHAACVRAVIDWIRGLFERHRDALAGIGAAAPPRSAAAAIPDRQSAAD